MKNASGNKLVRTKNRRYNNRTINNAPTINPPTTITSRCERKASEIVKTENKKEEGPDQERCFLLLLPNEAGYAILSTCPCGENSEEVLAVLFSSQLLIINPNNKMMISDGRCSNFPPRIN